MAFDGTEGGQIPLSEAALMTAEYREFNPNSVIAHFFGREILEQILSQENCMGIRIYYGLKDGQKELIIVGADSHQDDLTDLVGDISLPCPKACSAQNALNS